MPDPFISRQDLSDRLGRDVTADAGALSAVDAACEICRTISEQSFAHVTDTITFDGAGTDALVLPEPPINNVGTVLVNGTAETAFSWTEHGLLFRGSAGNSAVGWWGNSRPVWPQGRQNVRVTYDHGAGTVPADVREVALQLAMRAVVQGVTIREQVGDVSVVYAVSADDLTTNELRILNRYRRVRSF